MGKAANCHMLLKMIGEIKVTSDWLECVHIISFHVAKMFSESVIKSSSFLTNLFNFVQYVGVSYAIDGIDGGAGEMVSYEISGGAKR